MNRADFYKAAIRNLGVPSLLRRQMQKRGSNEFLKLTSKHLAFPVYARRGTSDIFAFDQVFVQLEYAELRQLKPRVIVDCGANVGYTSAYFLSVFPQATVIAIEPDPGNFQMLCRNLAPYTGRYKAIEAAVWPHREKITLNPLLNGVGDEWSRSVIRASSGDTLIETIGIPDLLAGHGRISILKIDIEGGEKELFSAEPERWLDQVDNIAIELHGDDARNIFMQAVAPYKFRFATSGDVTMCYGK